MGLLGILVGEQIVPFAKTIWGRQPAAISWLNHIKPHRFGPLPKGNYGSAEIAGHQTPPAKEKS